LPAMIFVPKADNKLPFTETCLKLMHRLNKPFSVDMRASRTVMYELSLSRKNLQKHIRRNVRNPCAAIDDINEGFVFIRKRRIPNYFFRIINILIDHNECDIVERLLHQRIMECAFEFFARTASAQLFPDSKGGYKRH